MKIGLYPGSFDPVTNGHLDIIERGRKIFDKLYVVISINPAKKTIFTIEERLELLKESLKDYDNVEVISSTKLTVDCAKEVGAKFMLRGLRAVSDFEYELQLSALNKTLNADIESIFVMSTNEYSFVSSTTIKEIARFKGDLSKFVPKCVEIALIEKFK